MLLHCVIGLKFFMQKLFPEKYFLGTELIQKDHVRQYESEVKAEFKSWADEGQVEKVWKCCEDFRVILHLNTACVCFLGSANSFR